MAVPGIVNLGVGEEEKRNYLCPPWSRPVAAAAAPPAFASASPDLIFMSPKDSYCLHCRPHFCATCLEWGCLCANLPTPWMRGPAPRLGP